MAISVSEKSYINSRRRENLKFKTLGVFGIWAMNLQTETLFDAEF